MSSRFGAASPSKAKNAKLKIMLASVFFLLLILLGALVWVLQNPQEGQANVNDSQVVTTVPVDAGTVGVLMPIFRIEAGQKLAEEMFKINYVPEDQVPQGAILAMQKGLIYEKFAAKLINPNVALRTEDVSDSPPLSSIEIPVGYRLITILVDNRSGVEGYAKAGARVDVLWTFINDGKKMIGTLARFVKVISLGGNTQNTKDDERVQVEANKQTTVSLLVTEKQAKYLELARSSGDLSLVLVGGTEPPPDIDAEPAFIEVDAMVRGNQKPQETEEKTYAGVTYVTDPVTGKQIKYVLESGRWKKDKSFTD